MMRSQRHRLENLRLRLHRHIDTEQCVLRTDSLLVQTEATRELGCSDVLYLYILMEHTMFCKTALHLVQIASDDRDLDTLNLLNYG